MRKFLPLLFFIVLIATVSATTINSEDVKVDLDTNSVHAEINVEELTSNTFSYASSHEISQVNGSVDGETLECSVTDSAIGSEIRCPTDLRNNFTVDLDFRIEGTVEQRNNVNVFRYSHPVYRPTDEYSLRVLLPSGNALVPQGNTTQQVISPLGYDTGSNGRQIYFDWDSEPELGETLSFYILFENVQDQPGLNIGMRTVSVIAAGLLALAVIAAFIIRWSREDLSENMEELSQDQKDIIEKLEENDGEYLQKDLVDEMDYSKAKISGEVSKLVDKGILKKSKEGRSNKLSISRKYRY